VSLALITSHLRIRMGKEESTIAKHQATRAINNTRITLSLSLKSLITSLSCETWRHLEALIVSWNGLLALVLNVKGWNVWVK
jgi:hypothetical protein